MRHPDFLHSTDNEIAAWMRLFPATHGCPTTTYANGNRPPRFTREDAWELGADDDSKGARYWYASWQRDVTRPPERFFTRSPLEEHAS